MKNIDFALILRDFVLYMVEMRLSDSGVILGLEPFNGVDLLNPVGGADGGGASLTAGNTLTWAGPITAKIRKYVWGKSSYWGNAHDAVKVHSVNTNGGVVFDTQVDVLRDTKTKVTSLREVPLPQLVLLDLETSLKNFLGLGAADSNMDGNLFVSISSNSPRGKIDRPSISKSGFILTHSSLPISRSENGREK